MDFVSDDLPEEIGFLQDPAVQDILEDPTCFIALVSPTGRHYMVSHGVQNVLGYTAEEYVKLNGLSQLLHPGDREVADASFSGLRDGPIELICRGLRKDGEYIWISSRLMLTEGLITALVTPTRKVIEGAVWAPTPPFI